MYRKFNALREIFIQVYFVYRLFYFAFKLVYVKLIVETSLNKAKGLHTSKLYK